MGILVSNDDLIKFLIKVLCADESGIACVGTELRRDDIVGLKVCDNLKKVKGLGEKIIKCPYGLENCLEKIIGRKIKKLLVIDAALPPKGLDSAVFLTTIDNASAHFIATTHNIPVPIVINYLRMNKVAEEVYLLGIVASDLSFGEGLTIKALKGLEIAQEVIVNTWIKCQNMKKIASKT